MGAQPSIRPCNIHRRHPAPAPARSEKLEDDPGERQKLGIEGSDDEGDAGEEDDDEEEEEGRGRGKARGGGGERVGGPWLLLLLH